MEHHFVVVYDEETGKWSVDTETTDAKFDGYNVYNHNKNSSKWREWNDNTSEALNMLIAILEKTNEQQIYVSSSLWTDGDYETHNR